MSLNIADRLNCAVARGTQNNYAKPRWLVGPGPSLRVSAPFLGQFRIKMFLQEHKCDLQKCSYRNIFMHSVVHTTMYVTR